MHLNWQTVTSSRSSDFEKNGTEIERASVPGTQSRFMLYSVRVSHWVKPTGGTGYVQLDCRYHVRDAETVTLEEIKAGKRPAIVARFDTLEEFEAWAAALEVEAV